MNRTDRLYAIAESLRAAGARGRTSAWLAERFRVSPRTIKRDVAALEAAGTPVVSQDGRGGGYQLASQASLPPLAFTGGEAAAIAVALGADADLPFSIDGRTALDKVMRAMTASQRAEVGRVAGRVWVRTRRRQVSARWAAVLDEALRRGVTLALDYEDGAGRRPRGRRVDPLAFARTGGHWYLLAWCHLREAGRWFRFDRIRGARLTRAAVTPRNLVDVFGTPPDDAMPISL